MPTKPFVLTAEDGEVFNAGPFHIVERVTGGQSDGLFEMYELTLGEATIDYHVHHEMDETLYVVEGQIEFNVQGKKYPKPAGSVAFVPRGVNHGFSNRGPAKAKVLITFTPSRSQNVYFRRLEALFSAPSLDVDALHALQKQFDQSLIPAE